MKAESKKKKKGFLGNSITHARKSLFMHEFSLHRLDHAYANPYPETLINTEIEQKLKT